LIASFALSRRLLESVTSACCASSWYHGLMASSGHINRSEQSLPGWVFRESA